MGQMKVQHKGGGWGGGQVGNTCVCVCVCENPAHFLVICGSVSGGNIRGAPFMAAGQSSVQLSI